MATKLQNFTDSLLIYTAKFFCLNREFISIRALSFQISFLNSKNCIHHRLNRRLTLKTNFFQYRLFNAVYKTETLFVKLKKKIKIL